jgi:putative CocE/NonD family hydrolase
VISRNQMAMVCHATVLALMFFAMSTPTGVTKALAEPAQAANLGERVLKVWIPMRDGVKLSARVFLPETEGQYPVVLQRTPYNKEDWTVGHDMWTQSGYVYVVQDVRGRFESEGTWYPFFQEKQDGYDTLAWIHDQPWSNGKVGMFGPSYNAIVQFAAIQGGSAPLLTSLIPTFVHGDAWERGWYSGGAFYLFNSVWWACTTTGHTDHREVLKTIDIYKFFRQLPLITLAQNAGCGEAGFFDDIVTHYTHDEYWKSYGIHRDYSLFTVPSLLIGGWYDYYPEDTFATYKGLVDHAPSRAIARSHKVLIGPWGHHHGMSANANPGDINYGESALDFGPDSNFEIQRYYREWFDRTLKGIKPPPTEDAPIRIFVMGTNKWRDENEWPLARTQFVRYYLHSGGKANTLYGDGTISRELPKQELPDKYTYDPDNPVPTHGGNLSVGPSPMLKDTIWAGPADQRIIEKRPDVLSYSSAPLEKDTEVTGPVILKLFAASSAPDTDFIGRLSDIYPDGRVINITEGVIRARFREKQYWEKPNLIKPGVIYEYTIDLQATSNVFMKGHRLRVDITSSDFPLWDRNLNTGHLPWLDTEIKKADQSIYHDGRKGSYLLLPIVPEKAK